MHTAPPSISPKPRLPMWPIFVCVAVTALGIGIVSPLMPQLLESHGANEFIIGLMTSVMFASLALTALPIGRKIDRWGIRPFIWIGLASYSVAMIAMPWTNRISVFFLLRAFEGVGWSAVWTAAETYVSRVSEPERRGHNAAVYGMSLAGGSAAGPLVGTFLWDIHMILPFVVAVVLAVLAGILVLLMLPEPHLHHETHDHTVSFSLTRPLVLPFLISFLYGYGTLSLIALVPTLNYGTKQIGVLITVTVIANIVAQVPVGRLVDRFGYRTVLISSLTLLSGAALLSATQPPFALVLFLGTLLGAFAGTLYPIGLAILAARVPAHKLGGANGMFTVCYGLGSFIGPALTGLSMQLVGKQHNDQALFGTIGCLVFLLLVAILLGIDKRSPEEQPVPSSGGGFKPPL